MVQKSKEEIVAEINEVIDGIRFYIQQDGGDLEFVSFDETNGIVNIKVLGACVGCALIDMTYKDGVETILKSEIKEVNSVNIIEENDYE